MKGRHLRIISLNIQHGWNTSVAAPAFPITRVRVLENLDKIVDLLRRHTPDVILLQEVDRISPLTRGIDQLAYIARKVGYLYHAHGSSSEMRVRGRLVYAAGCGVISRFPILKTEHVKFERCFPTPRKGFLVAELALGRDISLTVVSTHLVPFNLLNNGAKKGQIERMANFLENRTPIVIGGDFNSGLRGTGKRHIHTLARRLKLITHDKAHEGRLSTYPARRPRRKIDWVLASEDMKITDYRILRDHVSDHLAIRTTISL